MELVQVYMKTLIYNVLRLQSYTGMMVTEVPYVRPTKSGNVRFRNNTGAFASFPQSSSKLLRLRET